MKNKILWVEDENDQFRAFSYILKKDYKITRAIDFTTAQNIFNHNKFDLIIVDVILPSGYIQKTIKSLKNLTDIYFGIEFIKYIRTIDLGIPIIVVSVVTEKEKLDRINKIDSTIEYISKYDSTSEDVAEMVNKILSCQ